MCGCIMCTHGSLVEHGMVILGGLWWSFSHTWVCTNCSSLWMGCIISRLPDWCTRVIIVNNEQKVESFNSKAVFNPDYDTGTSNYDFALVQLKSQSSIAPVLMDLNNLSTSYAEGASFFTMCTGVHSYFSISSIISAILPKPPPSHQLSFPLTATMER